MSIISITSENFETEVLKSKEPVLVDFWADWCGPCQMMHPIMEELDKEAKCYKIAEMNIDAERELAQKYQVISLPCFIVFKDGEEVSRNAGVQPKKNLLKMLGVLE